MKRDSNKKRITLIERIGSKLPESNILFLILTFILIICSYFAQGEYLSVDKESSYKVTNIFQVSGFRWLLYNIIVNFQKYPPLGVSIVALLGFGVAEKVGLIGSIVKRVSILIPDKLLLPFVVFIGINTSIASDLGYIIFIPLVGVLFSALNRNPIVGIVAAFASVSAGYGANILPTPGDAILGSITQNISVGVMGEELKHHYVTMNLIFMIFSTLFLTFIITFVTNIFISKRVEKYDYSKDSIDNFSIHDISNEEKIGLRYSFYGLIVSFIIIGILYFTGILKSYEVNGKIVNPFLDNIIIIMTIALIFPSLGYGYVTKKIRSSDDYIHFFVSSIKDLAYIITYAVFAGNFLAVFNYSGLSNFIANHGAQFLLDLNISNDTLLLITFILLSALINLFIGSASAKWTLLAPIFIPMLSVASSGGITPEITQAAYRVGDSATNIITPLMPFIGIVILFIKKYCKKFEMGDLIYIMLPYSISILICWTLFFIAWAFFKLPFGI